MLLHELNINESGIIKEIKGNDINHQRLCEMGLIPGNTIKLIKYAPLGDPIEFSINGYTLSLRKEDAKHIVIDKTNANVHSNESLIKENFHPGIGENGIFHDKKSEKHLDNNKTITFALVGNQNSGKSTFFNAVTGSNQHIGNFPGVTVDTKEGKLLKYQNTKVIDLPGVYSLTPYSNEESITTNLLIESKPDGIINIIDVTSIERGLFLTLQLLELGIPMVLGLNMFDEFKKQNGYININMLEERLGIPVIPISAANNQGIEELVEHAMHVAYYQEKPIIKERVIEDKNYNTVFNTISALEHLLEDASKKFGLSTTFLATKYLENNNLVLDKINIDINTLHTFAHIKEQLEKETNMDTVTSISSYRYTAISSILKNIIKKSNNEVSSSSKADKILIGKYSAIPCFILIMFLIFYLSFDLIGPFFQNIINSLILKLGNSIDVFFIEKNVSIFIRSLVKDGVFSGLGTILSFIPIVLCLFLFLSLLEDSGYIARIAFIMDRPLRKIGLSGRSIIPILLGFGCTVPAVLSTRTLSSKRDRLLTTMLLPFISCSAKLPIYGFFCNLFFKKYTGLIVTGLYLFGIILAILTAIISKKTNYKGDAIPFIMELPPYRFPKAKNVLLNLWDKVKDYIKKTFSIILIATIIIWILSNIGFNLSFVENQSESILASIAKTISFIFKPLGFGNWQSIVSLITGFMAKETVVSSLNVLIGSANIKNFFTVSSAFSYMVFCLLYTPCIAAVSAIKNELGSKEAIKLIIIQCIFAWIVSFIIYQLLLIIL